MDTQFSDGAIRNFRELIDTYRLAAIGGDQRAKEQYNFACGLYNMACSLQQIERELDHIRAKLNH